MLTISILIVCSLEEDKLAVKTQLKEIPYICNYTFCSSWAEAILEMNTTYPDILLVDISCISFYDVSKIYHAISKESLPLIVFSNEISDALECYNSGIPTDFILKPFTKDRFLTAISRALSLSISYKSEINQNTIFLKVGRVFKKFIYEDIIYVEAYGIYSKIMTTKGKITVNDSIMKLEEKLSRKLFLRVHKSYMVNTSKVTTLKNNSLEMDIGEIPVGPRFKSALEGVLNISRNYGFSAVECF